MLKRQGARCKYLIDASALYPLIISGSTYDSEQFAITSLTEYEIGNVLWKENKKNKLKDPKRIAAIFSLAMSDLSKISFESVTDVLTIATDRDLSFYDASYAYIAEKNGLTLLTEDRHLLKKCKCASSTKEITKFVG